MFRLIFSMWQKLPLKRKIITILSFLLTCYLTIIIFSFLFNIILAICIFYIITKIFRNFFYKDTQQSAKRFKFYNFKNNSFKNYKATNKKKDDDMIEINPK
jgi:uncharacterized membrane protein